MKVIKVGAEWCSGCVVMRPRWKKIESENLWLKTQYYDFDESPNIVRLYDLENGKLPAFIFLDKNGKEILRLTGEVTETELLKVIMENKDR